MPELPENEAQRLTLERECLNRTIEAVELGSDTEYIELPGDNARKRLVGHQFTQTRRHGKNIFAGSKTGPWMAVHLGMTGRLVPFDAPDEAPEYTKLLIIFEGDRRLAFRCPRKLGHVRIIDDVDEYLAGEDLGPDALEIDKASFLEALGTTRSAIKSALMKQERIAGIGNLWSDEILFQTEIHPETRADELGEAALGAMHTAMRRILDGVIDTEAHYSELPRKWLIRHREKGAECRRCGGKIATAKVGGRTACFCKDHQS
ncbi:DNA-formamidopyrimidine glycosylase family protein [Qipengyuania sp. XHP0207]|uniref:DNA-formamidopyrimidine glycosylase family protein n=1 Tax=Qipengyuania sp. XHP0207 TaxID=3038078 RepID=UPI00241C3262|nr:DNA-formamidopyrimidine glycosylase family protein [Qipengyuania sp. XHP0207]MDG5748526.1 DNA-formamidopyrimidine glycosylase family protein [Qipengyuania sp. XHP0207]